MDNYRLYYSIFYRKSQQKLYFFGKNVSRIQTDKKQKIIKNRYTLKNNKKSNDLSSLPEDMEIIHRKPNEEKEAKRSLKANQRL